MKRLPFLLLFLSMQLVSCKVHDLQVSSLATEELQWKKQWMNLFFQEYRIYEEEILVNCHDRDRNIRFDIQRKIKAINQFAYSRTLTDFKRYADKNSITFDSLIMNVGHSWYYEKDCGFSPASFYLHSKGEIRIFMVHFDCDQNPDIRELEKEDVDFYYKLLKELHHGCGYGFSSITYFDKNLSNWEIRRIFINSEE